MVFQSLHALRARYSQSAKLKKIVANIGWLFVDKALRMVLGLFVGLWVARYLGPEKFGLLNYATAFACLFGTIAVLGIDSVLVREIAANPQQRDVLLGSAFGLKLTSSMVVLPIAIYSISLVRQGESELLQLVALCSVGFIVQSTNVIGCYFQSQVSSKYTVYATNLAFIIIATLRVGLVILGARVVAFGYANLAELILGSVFLILAYRHNRLAVRNWVFERKTALRLLRDGWPLIVSSVAITFYMRIDQVMIGQMLNDREVGIYSAAVRISEIWYFVPVAVVSTLFPVIIESRQYGDIVYNKRVGRLYSLMAWSGILVALFFTFLSSWLIQLLYGTAFSGSDSVLRIHIWAGVPVALGVAYGAVLTAENAQVITLYATLFGAGANVLLNWALIPRQGARGAAIATLASYWVVVLSTLIFKKSRRTGFAILKSFIFR
jgi:polysaccharide transporter, PST family